METKNNAMKFFYRFCTMLMVVVLFSNTVKAVHISGAEILYKCVGDNKYTFRVNLFADCATYRGLLFPDWELALVDTCGDTTYVNLSMGSPYEVSQLCPDALPYSQCRNGGGQYPGRVLVSYIGVGWYNDSVTSTSDTVPLRNCLYNIHYRSFDRNTTENVLNSRGMNIYVGGILDATVRNCNNSPTFNTPYPIPYVCVNQQVNYNFGVEETDGDSLSYKLICASYGYELPVTYTTGYSCEQPIPGIKIDSITGQLSFTATKVGNYIVDIEVSEYDRPTGKLIGKVMRDFQFVVQACSNNAPKGGAITNLSGTATYVGPYSLSLCEGDSFSFHAVFTDVDSSNSLSVITNLKKVLPNATISTTGKNPLIATISWKAPKGSSSKNNSFAITVQDDACPVPGVQIFGYYISLRGNTNAGSDLVICGTDSAYLSAKGGTTFTWSVLSGEAISVPSNFSCNPCVNPIAKPSITTRYIVTSNANAPCLNTDTVTVYVTADQTPPKINRVGAFCISDKDTVLTTTKVGGIWSGMGITDINKGIFSPFAAGTGKHLITYTVTGKCGGKDTMTIAVIQPPNVSLSPPGKFCSTDISYNLSAIPVGGKWSGSGITNENDGTFNPAVASVGLNKVTYSYFTSACIVSKSMDVEVIKTPDAPVITVPTTCFGDTIREITANDNGGIIKWYSDSILKNQVGTGKTFSPNATSDATYWVIESIYGLCTGPKAMVQLSFVDHINVTFIMDKNNGLAPLEVKFTNTSDAGVVNFDWNFGDKENNSSNDKNPVHIYNASGKYTVTLNGTDVSGKCSGTYQATIIVRDSSALLIPNVFTPNGDDKNPRFDIRYTGIKKVQGIIYNRWGGKVYEWNIDNVMDGENDKDWTGENAPDGVYFYIIKAVGRDEKEYDERGFVTLISKTN